jgi:hypothetical protein
MRLALLLPTAEEATVYCQAQRRRRKAIIVVLAFMALFGLVLHGIFSNADAGLEDIPKSMLWRSW